jgi:hypothetical protein
MAIRLVVEDKGPWVPEKIATLPIPEIRRLLAFLGFPSDLTTAIKVRHSARQGTLTVTKDRIYSTDGFKLEKTP